MGNLLDALGIGILAVVAWYIYNVFADSGKSTSKKVWDDAIKDANTRFKADEASGTLAPVTKCPSDPNLLAGDSRCGSVDTYYQSPTGWEDPAPNAIGTTVWGYDEEWDSYLPASIPPPEVHGDIPILSDLKDDIDMYNYLQGLI